ncbi:hypothetical protein BOX15_Mlig018326g1 [Macrostomum lignano]|uniref:CBS domain-containing protein n=2 Tax=Macrostomum lignano TaxID=282301 RepID=A0A267H3X2_9PLAT|nr:hypothetical protein BOX15_Mlig018326g1 [Macrostomum lignano]
MSSTSATSGSFSTDSSSRERLYAKNRGTNSSSSGGFSRLWSNFTKAPFSSATAAAGAGGRRARLIRSRKGYSTGDPPSQQDLVVPQKYLFGTGRGGDAESTNAPGAEGGQSQVPDRPRRNSDQGRVRIVAPATAGAASSSGSSASNRRSTVKQFFDNFRPRAKSECAQSIARPAGGKNRKASGEENDSSSTAANGDKLDSSVDGNLATIRQGEEFVGAAVQSSKKRSRSPLGLVNRLKSLAVSSNSTGPSEAGGSSSAAAAAGDQSRYRRRSGTASIAGSQPGQLHSLPHPSEMPLDCAYHDDVCVDKRNRIRKAISVDESYSNPNSYPPQAGNIQDRHRDLFENLSHSADVEGQCSILSPAAVAESQARSRRLSGPNLPMPARLAAPSAVGAVAGSNSGAPDLGCCGRRRTLSGAATLSTKDVQVTENDKYIIFKSKCQKSDCFSANLEEIQLELALGQPSQVFELFTRHHTCYDLIPTSSKLLVFDTNLNVRKAFFALVYNGLRAAPLWDSDRQKFVGILTVTDFIYILHKYYRSALVPMEVLETHRISTWQAELSSQLKPLTWISPEASLYDAIRVLLHSRVHRLPVIDPLTGNALYIVTHKRVLKFICLYAHQLPMPGWLDQPIIQLGIGTHSNIVTVSGTTSLVKVLSLFVQNRVSALPVLSSDGRLTDIYSKFDVINLAATKTYNNLDISVAEALQYRRERFEGVSKCSSDATLKAVIDQLVQDEVHRLVIVDQDNRVTGMVSLSDVLNALVRDYERLADHCSQPGVARETLETGL